MRHEVINKLINSLLMD